MSTETEAKVERMGDNGNTIPSIVCVLEADATEAKIFVTQEVTIAAMRQPVGVQIVKRIAIFASDVSHIKQPGVRNTY